MSPSVDGRGAGSEDRSGDRHPRDAGPGGAPRTGAAADVTHRTDGVPDADGSHLPVALLPGHGVHPELREVVDPRCRPPFDLCLRTAGPEAAPVGPAHAALASQVPEPPPVDGRPRHGLPGRAVRVDPSRSHRGDGVGGRRLHGDGHHVRGRTPTRVVRRGQRRALEPRDGTGAGVPRPGQRGPVLRHRLPGDAERPAGRDPRPVRLARRAGDTGVRRGHARSGGRSTAPPGSTTCIPIRRPSGSSSTRCGRCSPSTRRARRTGPARDGPQLPRPDRPAGTGNVRSGSGALRRGRRAGPEWFGSTSRGDYLACRGCAMRR